MKTISYLLSSFAIIALTFISCEKAALEDIATSEDLTVPLNLKGAEKVTLCHQANNTWRTITVSPNAVAAHIAHGDYYGPCGGDGCNLDSYQGFESNTNSWIGLISRVASGSDGINSSVGEYHANSGEYTYTVFDGYHNEWLGTWKAEIDVYLDPNWSVGLGFQYEVTASNLGYGRLRGFVFHVYVDESTGGLYVGGNNNISNTPPTNLEDIGQEITTPGWYTLQHIFSDIGGVLSVDMNIIDSNDNLVFIETLSNSLDLIPSRVGGNGWGWFANLNVDGGLAIDETKLTRCPD